jgi:hypothetical protein
VRYAAIGEISDDVVEGILFQARQPRCARSISTRIQNELVQNIVPLSGTTAVARRDKK